MKAVFPDRQGPGFGETDSQTSTRLALGTRVLAAWAPGFRRTALAAWRSFQQSSALGRRPRRMRVRETVSLGDKRSVSILEVDGQSFLIGCGSGSVSLLTSLETLPAAVPAEATTTPAAAPAFQDVFAETWRASA